MARGFRAFLTVAWASIVVVAAWYGPTPGIPRTPPDPVTETPQPR